MNNIAIVGGSGFIGTRLCNRLNKRSDLDFHIFDLAESSAYPEKYTKLDIRNGSSINTALVGFDAVINLAAEHKDNISPVSRYYETNVDGQKNLCAAMKDLNIKTLIFTSSVAVYGFVEDDTGESGKINPFNDYGKSKYEAELVADDWFEDGKQLSIIRPTVIFGEGNRGNVYNLLKQIASGKFIMVGNGKNQKSMAYVENIAAFIEHLIDHGQGHQIFNYVDKPDFDMNTLVETVNKALKQKAVKIKIPLMLGLLAGYTFDAIAKLTRREFPVSSIRIKKFCATTQFKSNTSYLGFIKPVTLEQGLSNTVANEFKGIE